VHDLGELLQLTPQCRQLTPQVCPDAGQARGDRRQVWACSRWPLLQCVEAFGQCSQRPPGAAVPFTFALQRSVQPLSIGGSWVFAQHGITPQCRLKFPAGRLQLSLSLV
jgi:hypothetical protein